jgi:hypothetical protein
MTSSAPCPVYRLEWAELLVQRHVYDVYPGLSATVLDIGYIGIQ